MICTTALVAMFSHFTDGWRPTSVGSVDHDTLPVRCHFADPAAGIGAGLLARRRTDGATELWFTCIPDLWRLLDEDGDGYLHMKQCYLHHADTGRNLRIIGGGGAEAICGEGEGVPDAEGLSGELHMRPSVMQSWGGGDAWRNAQETRRANGFR